MSDMPVIDEENSNYVKLPYTLTKGVTATREGLRVTDWRVLEVVDDRAWLNNTIPWHAAAKRLRYREGESYCESFISFGRAGNLICCPAGEGAASSGIQLHRLAAILCDDAEAFQVLHWCVTELGQEAGDD